ncbi:hypothetical protein NQ315_014217 [Exocentrus adspersus]|uniref:Retrotransposon gag domain-containing protein n=1 Tax=Exocentrus adspersus TaxID=1586481 RepID=A0AAV8V9J0_9CUCU|nr:hypothetical protein NQ315_014217 [Exocentrus adspersus]
MLTQGETEFHPRTHATDTSPSTLKCLGPICEPDEPLAQASPEPAAQTPAKAQVYPGHSKAKEPVTAQPLPQADVPPASQRTRTELTSQEVRGAKTPTDPKPDPAAVDLGDLRLSWIYKLRKDEIDAELDKFRLDLTGTVEEKKKRLVRFIREGCTSPRPGRQTEHLQFPVPPPLPTTGNQIPSVRQPSPTAPPATTVPPFPGAVSTFTVSTVCERVRKWNLRFNGKTDAVEFLEKLCEFQEHSGISTTALLPTLYEIFQGNALAWYRNNRELWSCWEDFVTDFKQFYLPVDYESFLEEQIYHRRQQPGESGRDYLVALQTLLRRHGGFTPEKALYRLHGNLRPEYKEYIRLSDVQGTRDLVRRIEEFETIQEEKSRSKARPPPAAPSYTPCSQVTAPPPPAGPPVPFRPAKASEAVTAPPDDNRPHVPVRIYDQTFLALIDTGAARSYIGNRVHQHCDQQGVPNKTATTQHPASKRNDQLYRHFWDSSDLTEPDLSDPWKLCVPTPLRRTVLQENHDAPSAGHMGIAKTIARIAQRYYWPGMFRDVAKYDPEGPPEEDKEIPTAHTERLQKLQEVYELVRVNLAQAFTSQSHYYNLRRREWRCHVGDRVMKRENPLSSAAKGFAAKLAPKYSGPYTVTAVASPEPAAQTPAKAQVYPGHSKAKEPVTAQPLPQADVPPASQRTRTELTSQEVTNKYVSRGIAVVPGQGSL